MCVCVSGSSTLLTKSCVSASFMNVSDGAARSLFPEGLRTSVCVYVIAPTYYSLRPLVFDLLCRVGI